MKNINMEIKLRINTRDLLQNAISDVGEKELFKLLWDNLNEKTQQDWIESHLSLISERAKDFFEKYDNNKEQQKQLLINKQNYQAMFQDKDFIDCLLKFLKDNIKLVTRYGRTELQIDGECNGSITEPIDWTRTSRD